MPTTRREFLATSMAATAGLAAVTLPVSLLSARARAGGLKILILGGTGFLGPACVDAAVARGHTVTLFNRGRTEKRRGGLYPDIEKLYGNRDPEKIADETKDEAGNLKFPDSPKGLKALEGRKWDAVIDTSGYYPRIVKASAELLAPNVGHYVYISSISAYKSNDKPGNDENAAVGTMADPTVENMGANFENYGPLKALCEQAAEAALPGRVANIRPGYIVGPGDPTDRFTYWPVTIAKGGDVLCPGAPSDPVQFIDVRDLGEWIVKVIEDKTVGFFNACGPQPPATWGGLLDTCNRVSGGKANLVYADAEFLGSQGVQFPIWIPSSGETAGFHTWSIERAIKAGLKSRSIDDTVKATLEWWDKQTPERQARMGQMVKPETVAAALAAWQAKNKK